jgi:hypothetical protein
MENVVDSQLPLREANIVRMATCARIYKPEAQAKTQHAFLPCFPRLHVGLLLETAFRVKIPRAVFSTLARPCLNTPCCEYKPEAQAKETPEMVVWLLR